MAKRHTKRRREKKHHSRRRTMKGGDRFTEKEKQELRQLGFSDSQIESLQDLGVSLSEVMQKVNIIMNESEGSQIDPDFMTEQVMVQLLNEHIEPIPHADSDVHDLDMGMDSSFTPQESQGPMDINELNITNGSDMSGYTTGQDASQITGISFNSQGTMGTMNEHELNISNMSGNTTRDNSFGGKKRRRSSKKRRGKGRKTRKYRGGGMCFGNGVGANSHDPNNSIYNTNMLKLFPYKAN
jgi:hypothetical protein